MRRIRLIALLAGIALLLCGCGVSGEVENQAYVLVLGVDRLDEGQLELTARVPRIGKSKPGDSGEGGGDYLTFSASGSDYPQALEALEQATPRQMNLSHIELLVASEALAREQGFASFVSRIAETPHLYTTARFVVCEGRARDFIEAQETVIGTRLSSEIDAMLDHYAQRGYIPDARFADAHYLMGSVYGDPLAILGFTAQPAESPALSLIGPSSPTEGIASPMGQRFWGAALFYEGRMIGALDARQTMILNLIRGGGGAIPFECDGRSYTLTPEGRTRREVRLEHDGAVLRVTLRLNTLDDVCDQDAARLEDDLKAAILNVIYECQRVGAEPFGFSECAAGHFSTLADWQAFDWREKYADARVEADVCVRSSAAEVIAN